MGNLGKVFFVLKNLYKKRNIKTLKKSVINAIKSIYLSEKEGTDFSINVVMSKPLKVGIIGGGDFAKHHLDVLKDIENTTVVSMCATGSKKSRDLAKKYHIEKYYTDIGEFILKEQNNIDVLFVVVPILQLKDIVMTALEMKKPIMMEKPAGLSSAETQEIIQKANYFQVDVIVGYNRRFFSSVRQGLAALASMGSIRAAILEVPESMVLQQQKKRDKTVLDNWIFAQSSHAIDLFKCIMGEHESINVTKNFGQERVSFEGLSYKVDLNYANGSYGTILGLWDSNFIWKLRIIADLGSVEFMPLEEGLVIDKNKNIRYLNTDDIDIKYRKGLYFQDYTFLSCIADNKPMSFPLCTLEDAYSTNKLVESIYEK